LDNADVSTVGSIFIQPIVGPTVEAKLVALDVSQYLSNAEHQTASMNTPPLHVTFAVSDRLNGHDVVLPAGLAEELKTSSQYSFHLPCVEISSLQLTKSAGVVNQETVVSCEIESTNIDQDNSFVRCDEVNSLDRTEVPFDSFDPECVMASIGDKRDIHAEHVDVAVVTVDAVHDSSTLVTDANHDSDQQAMPITRELLAKEQATDASLAASRELANAKKGGFEWRDGLLYHIEKIHGYEIVQLVIPMCKREYLLQLAHIQCGFHQGQKRTLERIRLSGLYFPGIKEAVYSFCNQCRPCAQARGVRKLDRVPITPIPRAEVPGQHIFMDVIGPIEPSSGNFKYLLCTVDSCTSWPTVYLLRNLTAKAVCECLCDLFSFLGVAAVISSDQGSNFTSQLTKLFLEKMGCAPRWASPAHPEASGKVERFNASFKRMLHHVILDNPSSWHKYVPFMTWAMRECSNATTGVPPYTLLFGRLPRGPLAVLRDSWQGDIELPVGLGKSAEQYLHDLHAQLKRVHKYAGEHASVAQERYAKAYNKHARPKSFEVDEEVIVLYPDSTNKLRIS
jgi:hypothetical protein